MQWVLGGLGLAVALWMIAEPFLRSREASSRGEPALPFPRMVTRSVTAFCVACIVLLMVLSPVALAGRGPLAQLLYWTSAILLALVMFLAGLTEMALVRKQLLEQERDLVRQVVKKRARPTEGQSEERRAAAKPGEGGNGRGNGG
ncbi:MAG TPA: hypothetical protein VGN26_04600 [Armatimonadota bacterium]|jgi:small-conductance mechanosensitive channel